MDKIKELLELTDEEFELLSKDDTNLDEFKTKINDKFSAKLKADIESSLKTEIEDKLKKDSLTEIINKTNTIKREIKREFGLAITDDELKKIDVKDLLKMTKEKKADMPKNDYLEVVEKLEEALELERKQKNEIEENYKSLIEKKEQELKSFYESKLKEKDIVDEIYNKVGANKLVPKENVAYIAKAINAVLKEDGFKLDIMPNKQIKVLDADSMPAKDNDGTLIKIDAYINNWITKFSTSIVDRGTPNQTGATQVKQSFARFPVG